MRKRYKKIGDVLSPDYSIFQSIYDQYLHTAENPLFDDTVAALLDDMYVNDWAYDKIITRALDRALVNDELPRTALNNYASKIWQRFAGNWKHYFEYVAAEYNPIDNYNMYQIETPNITETTDTKTNTNMTVETDGDENTNITTEDQTYGYNSSNPVDTNKSTTTGDKDNNTTHSETTTTGDWDDNKTNEVKKEEGTRELERRGNIGVTTTAQMLAGDSNFWQNWDLVSAIFKDVDRVLTLGVY